MICNVVGARPNYMKIAPIVKEMKRLDMDQALIHTGQHYDDNMAKVFFDDLGLPKPDLFLNVGSGSHASQTAKIMTVFERYCLDKRPSCVVVGGDVNSTLAVSLVAAKMHIPVAHVEAGLRSFDRRMPEEINRIVTDHLSEFLFTTEESAEVNLKKEGISPDKIHFVGNCMVDSLLQHIDEALKGRPWDRFSLTPTGYGLVTLHRPSNVDDKERLLSIMTLLNDLSTDLPLLFPLHPRTRKRFEEWKIATSPTLVLSPPLSYLDFLGLLSRARVVLTDSGGIQEETTVLSVPCMTLRQNTERPVTLTEGTNELVGTDPELIRRFWDQLMRRVWKKGKIPSLWDGKASVRICEILQRSLY